MFATVVSVVVSSVTFALLLHEQNTDIISKAAIITDKIGNKDIINFENNKLVDSKNLKVEVKEVQNKEALKKYQSKNKQ